MFDNAPKVFATTSKVDERRVHLLAFTKLIGGFMSVGTILLIILVLMLIGVFPTWSHSSKWGYGPTGGLGVILLVVLVLVLMGKI